MVNVGLAEPRLVELTLTNPETIPMKTNLMARLGKLNAPVTWATARRMAILVAVLGLAAGALAAYVPGLHHAGSAVIFPVAGLVVIGCGWLGAAMAAFREGMEDGRKVKSEM